MTSTEDTLAEATCYIINVEAVVFREGKFLLIRRSLNEEVAPGLLSFPGGKLDEHRPCADVLEDSVRRELAEETGVRVSKIVYAGSKIFLTNCGRLVLNLVFACSHASGEGIVAAPEELTEAMWLTEGEIRKLAELPPWALDTLERALLSCLKMHI